MVPEFPSPVILAALFVVALSSVILAKRKFRGSPKKGLISPHCCARAEFLRNLYASSGLSIKPKTRLSQLDQLKIFVESLGFNSNEILSRDALAMTHRTVIDPEQRKMDVLNQALKEAIIKELNQGILQHV